MHFICVQQSFYVSMQFSVLLWNFHIVLGPIYTTVEKSTGHEKNGVSQLWLVENATLDRWVFTLGEENNGGEIFSWMIKWHGCLRGGTFWSWASPERSFNKKYFIAFNSSPAHPPSASYNHVLAKHSWPTGGLLHRNVNRPLGVVTPPQRMNNGEWELPMS